MPLTRCKECSDYHPRSLLSMYPYCETNNYVWKAPLGLLIGCSQGTILKQSKRTSVNSKRVRINDP